jgi:hypothetical protein
VLESTTTSRPTSTGINNRVTAIQHWNQQPRHGRPALESTTASWLTSAGINNRVTADQLVVQALDYLNPP